MSWSLRRDLCFLVLQFLNDEKLSETAHNFEKESGVFFNLSYFEKLVMAGRWTEADSYLAGFTAIDDNFFSRKAFFEIRKQNFFEALDRNEKVKAIEILSRDLKVFESTNRNLYKDLANLLALDNFRENEQLAHYGDTNSVRAMVFSDIKKLVVRNPLLCNKLQFPSLKSGSLRCLLNQSVNGRHHQCKVHLGISLSNLDHSREQSQPQLSGPRVAAPVSAFDGVSQLAQGFQQASIGRTLEDAPILTPFPQLGPSNSAVHFNHPLSPSNVGATKNHLSSDHEHALKRPCIVRPSIEVTNVLPTAHLPVTNSGIARNQYSLADLLPKSLAVTLEQGSKVMSMDFHPSQLNLLLVGTNVGDTILWDVALSERLAYRRFSAWDLDSCSYTFQVTLIKDSAISVNKVAWSHDGSQFGVAHSKHLVHLYTFNGRGNLGRHLEIDAHVGGVNDLAFSQPNRHVTVVTCGDDKLIKVWDTTSGAVQFTFQSDIAVCSICPQVKMNIQFVLSTSSDGRIIAWVFGNSVPKLDYSLVDHAFSRIAYTDDGTRLFSCGTRKGDTCIVEWVESDGSPKRTYVGFRNASKEVVQFDTTKNRFLAAGDDFLVKFWDMDETTLLATTDAEGGLPASPRIRFNKSGSLLAVSTSDNCIKILANVDGLQLLCSLENQSKNGDTLSLVVDVEDIIIDKPTENSKPWKVHEINEPSQCCSLSLPESLVSVKVPGLVYMNSGTALLALGSNGVHKLWRWPEMAKNGTGQATTSLPPVLWKPPNAENLTNDLSNLDREEADHFFALSKNDSYILSTSGGKISLFNILKFKTMCTFMPPPPAATCIAFYPQDNNIIAIGMGDGSINIYNMQSLQVKTKLKGHQKRVTGLAFSSSINVLASAGLDARLCIWATDSWGKKASILLEIPIGRKLVPDLEMRVQFHNDLVHFLVVHGLQLAIYDAKKLERCEQWIPPPEGVITSAAYSCDGEMIYATFMDGSVSVFTAALQLRCQINPSAYPSDSASLNAYPLIVAAHPSEPNQFALGLTDGDIYVFEPLEAEGKWGAPPPEGDPL